MRRPFASALLAILCLACASSRNSARDDEAVLRAVLADFLRDQGSDELLILNTSLHQPHEPFFIYEVLGRPAPLSEQLLIGLRKNLMNPRRLPRLSSSVEQVSEAELHERWPSSVQNYKHLFVAFSLPAYSEDRTSAAVVVLSHFQGPCCARGYIVRLHKNASGWQVVMRVDEYIE